MPELWEQIFKVADAAKPKFQTALLDFFDGIRDNIKFAALQKAMRQGNTVAAWNAIPWQEIPDLEVTAELNKIMAGIFKEAGAKTMADMMGKPKVNFNVIDEDTASFWAQNESSFLITHIMEDTRKAIQQSVLSAFQDGLAPPAKRVFTILEHAMNMREDFGLNQRQVRTMDNFRRNLRWRNITGPAADKLVRAKQVELLRARADMIARTETIQSASEGQRAVWDMQVADGAMDSARWEVEWLTTPDDVTCERCRIMNKKRRPIDGVYTGVPNTGSGAGRGLKGPTLHPNCRCTERLVPKRGRSMSQKTKARIMRRNARTKAKMPPMVKMPKAPAENLVPEYDGVKFEWDNEVAKNHPDVVAAIGHTMRVDDYDLDAIRTHLYHMDLMDKKILAGLGQSGVKFHFGDGAITGLDKKKYLENVQPRGWPAGSTFKEVGGVYSGGESWVLVGNKGNGSVSVALHETGHAVGDHYWLMQKGKAVGVEDTDAWRKIHARLYKQDKLSDYYRQDGAGGMAGRQELLAEAWAWFFKKGEAATIQHWDKAVVKYIKQIIKNGKAHP